MEVMRREKRASRQVYAAPAGRAATGEAGSDEMVPGRPLALAR